MIGAGVPLFWIWVGSLIQGSRGAQGVEASTAVIMIVGILVSYVVILIIAGAIQARSEGPARAPADPLPVEPQHARRALPPRDRAS